MSDDFSRFAILAMPIPETVIPADLITGLEVACNQGPLGPNERRPIGTVAQGCEAPILSALRKKLHPLRLDVTPQAVLCRPNVRIEISVHRLAT